MSVCGCLLCPSSQVVWVGRSSMEVLLELSTSGKKQLAEGQGADVPGVVLILFFFP